MPIWSFHGDIFDDGQKEIEMAAVMLRGGFRGVHVTWTRFIQDRGLLLHPELTLVEDEPWRDADVILAVEPPANNLRYIYAFHNHNDEFAGHPSLEHVGSAVDRVLDKAHEMGVHRAGMIHLKYAPAGHAPNAMQEEQSAIAMITAIQEWEPRNPHHEIEVILYDLKGAFDHLAEAMMPDPPEPEL